MLFEGKVRRIRINDLDRSIFCFWKVVTEQPEEFCAWIKAVPITMDSWHKYKAIQNDSKNADQFELAKSTFFLNRTNISGIIKGGVIGGQTQAGKYKLNARFNKADLLQRIKNIAAVADCIKVSNDDGLEFLKKIDSLKKDIFIYLDPPYYQKGAQLYMNSYVEQDHEILAEYVKGLQKKCIVSYDNHQFILKLYPNQKKVVYKLSQSTSNRVGDEVLIFGKDLSFTQAVKQLHSPVLA